MHEQKGQTLVETMVAAFVLTMGITAAVGLAIFAFNTSTNIVKQIIGNGLAREGLEAVKNMRDTNWLKQTAIDLNCYNYEVGTNTARCYRYWLGKPGAPAGSFNIEPTGGVPNYYRLKFDPTNMWTLTQGDPVTGKWGLDFNTSTSSPNFSGYYTVNDPINGSDPGVPDNRGTYYYRTIILTKEGPSPYNTDPDLIRLKVQSQVWWTDKKCPQVSKFSQATVSCRIELITYLTNWKNY